VFFEIPVTVQCAAVPASHADRHGTMSSMTSASTINLRDVAEHNAANLRSSRSLGQFPSPPVRAAQSTFDAAPPESPTYTVPDARTRMNSKTWEEHELPGLPTAHPPQLASPVSLQPLRTKSRHNKTWTLVKPGLSIDTASAPTPPPTCPIPDVPTIPSGGVAPLIPPRSSSRLASARQTAPTPMSRSTSIDELGGTRRGSQDTITTSSVHSSPSDYSGRSSVSTAATSVSSPVDTAPLKPRCSALTPRKIEEMGSGEPLREGFHPRIFRVEKGELERREFQRRIDLALSEVEMLALEESDGDEEDEQGEVRSIRRIIV
jgi:hypothetical protein